MFRNAPFELGRNPAARLSQIIAYQKRKTIELRNIVPRPRQLIGKIGRSIGAEAHTDKSAPTQLAMSIGGKTIHYIGSAGRGFDTNSRMMVAVVRLAVDILLIPGIYPIAEARVTQRGFLTARSISCRSEFLIFQVPDMENTR